MCACLFVVLTITVTWLLGDLHFPTHATSPLCTAITSSCNDHSLVGVWIQWNGIVDWNGGMDWNGGLEWNGGMELW